MILSEFLVVSLAVFSITYLLRYFDGPFALLRRFREFVGIKYVPELDSDGNTVDTVEEILQERPIARLVGCHWCMTTWVALIMFVSYIVVRGVSILWLPVLWFGGVAVSGLLHDYNTR